MITQHKESLLVAALEACKSMDIDATNLSQMRRQVTNIERCMMRDLYDGNVPSALDAVKCAIEIKQDIKLFELGELMKQWTNIKRLTSSH